jgi:hypothetical protein
MLAVWSCKDAGSVKLEILSLARDTVSLKVTNRHSSDIVLLSPESPRRQLLEHQCLLNISTNVDGRFRPFAFTPALVVVGARSSTSIRVRLAPGRMTSRCRKWKLAAKYAYLSADEIAEFRGMSNTEIYRRVMTAQRIVFAETVLSVAP